MVAFAAKLYLYAWYTNIIRLDEKLISHTLGGPGLC